MITTKVAERTIASKTYQHIKLYLCDHPAVYLAFISCFALIGYAYLLMFPLITVVASYKLMSLAPEFSNIQMLPITFAWFACLVTGAMVSNRIVTFKMSAPRGVALNLSKAPELCHLLAQLKKKNPALNLHRIILNEQNKMEIIKTPVYGIPARNTNTLIIGLPVFINLTKSQFKSALTRKILQNTPSYTNITNWIVCFRQSWSQYQAAYNAHKDFSHFPLRTFFSIYTPLFDKYSAMAVRLDELNIDSKLLNEINDEDLLDMIQGEFVSRTFLENAYWPRIRKFVRKSPSANITPHNKMAKLLQKGLPQKDAMHLLANALHKSDPDNLEPSLRDRMNNIGHQRIKVPYQANSNAAQAYLGNSYGEYIKLIDISWMSSTLSKWKQQDKELRHDHHELNSLKDKANGSRLSYKEMLAFSRLSKRLYGKSASIALKDIIRKKLPQAA